MNYPILDNELLLKRLDPPTGKIRMVLDTDTYNEVDDQFALVYSLLSPEKLIVEAVYAAPFWNKRSSGPGDGMQKSYEEILRLLERLGRPANGFVYRGSEEFIHDLESPSRSEAALDLVERALRSKNEPLYVVAIAAITNVVSAILIEPKIIEKIVVVWLGGQPHHWPNTRSEFNLKQDLLASQFIFNCGVPLIQIPCLGVASHLLTTIHELKANLKGKGKVGDYLFRTFNDYRKHHFAWAKEIWDISAVAWLINAEWIPSVVIHSPVLTDQYTWSVDNSRHFMRCATFAYRNPIFGDLFTKIQEM